MCSRRPRAPHAVIINRRELVQISCRGLEMDWFWPSSLITMKGRGAVQGGRRGDLGTDGDCLEQCAGHAWVPKVPEGCSSFISGLAFGFRGWLAVQLDACVPWSGAPHCAIFFMRGLAGEKMSLVVNWLSGSHLSFEFCKINPPPPNAKFYRCLSLCLKATANPPPPPPKKKEEKEGRLLSSFYFLWNRGMLAVAFKHRLTVRGIFVSILSSKEARLRFITQIIFVVW